MRAADDAGGGRRRRGRPPLVRPGEGVGEGDNTAVRQPRVRVGCELCRKEFYDQSTKVIQTCDVF